VQGTYTILTYRLAEPEVERAAISVGAAHPIFVSGTHSMDIEVCVLATGDAIVELWPIAERAASRALAYVFFAFLSCVARFTDTAVLVMVDCVRNARIAIA
jgi:hypothetical protein